VLAGHDVQACEPVGGARHSRMICTSAIERSTRPPQANIRRSAQSAWRLLTVIVHCS